MIVKEHESSGLLISLGKKTTLSKISLVGHLFFNSIKQVNTKYKMNEIINSYFLAGDKFIPEIHLRRTEFSYSTCRP